SRETGRVSGSEPDGLQCEAAPRRPRIRSTCEDGGRSAGGLVALEVERGRVHAVALAGGGGPVGEDVAEVRVAGAAADLRAHHAVARVGEEPHPVWRDRLPEARPAA